ncbi:hypothetical protein FRC03_002156 [Tulasnella sp. 419]|nr:hypothetical protein FRC03_002156 [Tulasnella sp. 419]
MLYPSPIYTANNLDSRLFEQDWATRDTNALCETWCMLSASYNNFDNFFTMQAAYQVHRTEIRLAITTWYNPDINLNLLLLQRCYSNPLWQLAYGTFHFSRP